MGGGVQDPDHAQHLPRLPAALLGPGQPGPQPGRDEEGGLPRPHEAGHAPRVGGPGAARQPREADGRVLVPRPRREAHRPQNQEELPEDPRRARPGPRGQARSLPQLKSPDGTNLINNYQ